jgi:hypothetical protein
MDTAKAIKATAHQSARLIDAMLTNGQAYVELATETLEARSKERQLGVLQRKARKFGPEVAATAWERLVFFSHSNKRLEYV